MASKSRGEAPDLNRLLYERPTRFDFFQAVRLLELWLRDAPAETASRAGAYFDEVEHGGTSGAAGYPVGYDYPPEQEAVRFRAYPSLKFPSSQVTELEEYTAPAVDSAAPDGPSEMTVTFLGLTGPSGVLPHHYTTLLVRRLREKDSSLRDFLDVFNHRLISLFFRAWEKYRLPFSYERSQAGRSEQRGSDPLTDGLYCLVGLGTDGLRDRQEVDDEIYIHYGGHFSRGPRSASALEAFLADQFEMPIRIAQFQGQWLYLDPDDHALMPSVLHPRGRNNMLGQNLVIGERVWDVQSKFRIRIGPLNYRQFRSLMPNGDALLPICQATRTYVGPGFDFDVQPVLRAEEVPWCRLSGDGGDGPFLGWNTWVRCAPFAHDVDDTAFSLKNQ